jgi:4,5-dihydroxyphthalate decarboxylase
LTNRLRLSLACWDYDRTERLRNGLISPAGVEVTYVTLPAEDTFFRMLRHQEFDIAEMSLSSYVLTLAQPDRPFVAIPVFPSRMFRHGSIYIPPDSDLTGPSALAGRTVGIPEYQMTAAVWIRGILADQYGVPADSVHYRTGGLHDAGRTEKLPLSLPDRFDVQPIEAGQTLDGLLAAGQIDALYTARAPRSFHRDQPGGVRRLFPDAKTVEQEYFRQTSIFPIMHTIVMRRDVYERDRWIARSLLDAFVAAKAAVYTELAEVTALKYTLPWAVTDAEDAARLMGADFWPYGLAANLHTLEVFLRYSHDQGLAHRVLSPAELFAAETLDAIHV